MKSYLLPGDVDTLDALAVKRIFDLWISRTCAFASMRDLLCMQNPWAKSLPWLILAKRSQEQLSKE